LKLISPINLTLNSAYTCSINIWIYGKKEIHFGKHLSFPKDVIEAMEGNRGVSGEKVDTSGAKKIAMAWRVPRGSPDLLINVISRRNLEMKLLSVFAVSSKFTVICQPLGIALI
jgi:hypothetical protein